MGGAVWQVGRVWDEGVGACGRLSFSGSCQSPMTPFAVVWPHAPSSVIWSSPSRIHSLLFCKKCFKKIKILTFFSPRTSALPQEELAAWAADLGLELDRPNGGSAARPGGGCPLQLGQGTRAGLEAVQEG